MSLRLALLGTGSFALPTFRELYKTDHEVVGLVTQPDRIARGNRLHRNELKEEAIVHDTAVFQPDNINTPESLDRLRQFEADLYVVAAYGQILSAELLGIPRMGAVNLHASLLPKYRGAAPIQYAVWKGERETGITIFQIEPRLDAGPILGVVSTAIGATETYGQLQTRLANLSVPLTRQVLDDLEHGTTTAIVQNPGAVTRAPRIKKSQGQIQWSQTAEQIDCHIRAMQPWPKPFSFLDTSTKPERLLILSVARCDDAIKVAEAVPGTIVAVDSNQIVVETGDGRVRLLQVQPEGKRPMNPREYLAGHPLKVGQRFIECGDGS